MEGQLTPAQGSALSLLLRHGQSYGDVGRRLGIDPMSVRARAHEAVARLAGMDPLTGADGALLDGALGQCPPGEAAGPVVPSVRPGDAAMLARVTEALGRFLDPSIGPVAVGAVDERRGPVNERTVPVEGRSAQVAMAPGRTRRLPRGVRSARLGAMLSLGLGLLAAGAVLFVNGAH